MNTSQAPATAPAKEEIQETTQAGKKILIVDDDEFMRFAITHKLREAGYLVSAAADGGEAIEQLKKARPDLILLDLMMPYVSGPDFLHLINTHYSSEPKIPVIIISSLDQAELREAGYKLEGYHFIPKPLIISELLHWIKHFLAFGEN
ncbi:MAG TPA: response regulator [Bacteroidia bacterium]|jgi:CheY-like chemotaxis protein|nr:response regulator [Bacteroidia bacterium]